MTVARPIRARIDLAALRHNYGVAKQQLSGTKLWAVVKANAYGHGLLRAVRALQAVADGFALIELERAIELRHQGLTQSLLLLEGWYRSEEIPLFIQHRISPVVHRAEQVQAMLQAGWPRDLPVYLKLDSGMHRLGMDAAGLTEAHTALAAQGIEQVLMMHFADADGPRGIDWQLERFAAMTTGMNDPRSLGNSATILRYPDQVGDWARPGIMLYGASPFADSSAAALGLQPVMTLESELMGVQQIAAGESVGYGCTFTAVKPMRIGVVACGYADGYPRHAPTGTPILVGGWRTRTLGRVSMDKLCVDLTDAPEKVGATIDPTAGTGGETATSTTPTSSATIARIDVGTPVTLWGEGLPADAVAAAAGTISYELFCALAQRVPVIEVG